MDEISPHTWHPVYPVYAHPRPPCVHEFREWARCIRADDGDCTRPFERLVACLKAKL